MRMNFTLEQKNRRHDLLLPYSRGNHPTGNGITYFNDLPLSVIQELDKSGFLEHSTWNSCPGNLTFLQFMETHPKFTAHGYAVSFQRDDARVTIEGLECRNLTKEELADFAEKFSEADEFEVNRKYARCWYD